LEGNSWQKQCESILSHLGNNVYVSFDIDGLDPRFCPNTGTPVPGGLDFNEVLYLFAKVKESGRTIVGADLVEIAPGLDEWD
ncbi:agmatinase, partial [Pseudomonas sp. MPR-TSA4]|uniref:arginase family protein n=1 Tax=Pseudomonas sp. MPR-TSA4 TaxID=2070594 RepID=UPI000CACDC0E